MKFQKSFTVIELLVVIAVIGLLASIVLVSTQGAKNRAKVGKSLSFSGQIQRALGDNILVHYDFSNVSGNVARDISDNGIDAAINGATQVAGVPEMGNALNFDGNDYVLVPSSTILNNLGKVGTSYSIGVWFRSTVSADQSLTEKWIGTPYPWAFRGPNPYISFNLYDGVNDPRVSSNPLRYNDGVWHFALGIRDADADKIILYVDGTLINQATDTTVGDISNIGSFPIGARTSISKFFNGIIDEVSIYGKALSSTQIQQIYAKGAIERRIVLNK